MHRQYYWSIWRRGLKRRCGPRIALSILGVCHQLSLLFSLCINNMPSQKKTLAKEGILNLGRNERSSTRRIYLVVPVLRSNYNTVLADVVSLVANNQDFARRNASERLVLVGIAKGDNCTSLATITTNRYGKKETYQQKPSPPAPHSISASQYAQAAHPGCNPTPQSSCWGTASPPD
jgi:hypothetical protein